jgi:hypothetical protein
MQNILLLLLTVFTLTSCGVRELYPPQGNATPTPIASATPSPTQSNTPTPTPSLSVTPSPTPTTQCPSEQFWDGSACDNRCRIDQQWTGSSCISKCAPDEIWDSLLLACAARCVTSQYWNGTSCTDRCASNQSWINNACVTNTPTPSPSPTATPTPTQSATPTPTQSATPSPSATPVPTASPTPAPTVSPPNVCSMADETFNLSLSCPTGQVIVAITQASFGTPVGSCGDWSINYSCNAISSEQIVSNYCIGQQNCTVAATDAVFGDPCVGTTKKLFVNAVCGDSSNLPSPTPTATPTQSATPTPIPAAKLTISDSPTFDFGSTTVGSVLSHTFIFTNIGGSTATILYNQSTPSVAPFIGGTTTCGNTIAAGQSCSTVIQFTPTTQDSFYQTPIVEYNDGFTTQSVSVTLLGNAVCSSGTTFNGTSCVSNSSGTPTPTPTQSNPTPSPTVTPQNICGSAAEASNLTLSCPAGEVITSITQGSFGTPNGSCGNWTINQSCNASTSEQVLINSCVGQQNCTIAATDSVFGDPCVGITKELIVNAVCGSPSSVPTPTASPSPTATATPNQNVTPAQLVISDGPDYSFGTNINTGSFDSHTFTVTNTGGTTATSLSFSALDAPFTVITNNCGQLLLPSASCDFTIQNSPNTAGSSTSAQNVNYNNGTTSVISYVNVSESSQGPTIPTPTPSPTPVPTSTPNPTVTPSATPTPSVSPSPTTTPIPTAILSISDFPLYNFGSSVSTGTTLIHSFTLTNSGESSATGINLLTPINAPYYLINNNCPQTLAPSSDCTFGIQFSPTSSGEFNQSVNVGYNNGSSSTSIVENLSGTGVAATTPTPSPTASPMCDTSVTFVSGSILASDGTALSGPVATGSNFTVTCDYGSPDQSTYVSTSASDITCSFLSFNGSVGSFNCPSGSQPGTYSFSCNHFNASSQTWCSQTETIGNVVVASSAPSPTVTPSPTGSPSPTAIPTITPTATPTTTPTPSPIACKSNQYYDGSTCVSNSCTCNACPSGSNNYSCTPNNCSIYNFTTTSADHKTDKYATSVCNPLGTNTYVSSRHGARGYMKYLPASKDSDSGLMDYELFGVQEKYPVYTDEFNLPTTNGGEPISTTNGTILKNSSGAVVDHYMLHFAGQIKLGEADTPKKYQFALLSDDGAIFSMNTTGLAMSPVINNDGDHDTTLACETTPINLSPTVAESVPFTLDYYQGPVARKALILLFRESTTTAEPLCGVSGDDYWFDFTTKPPTALDPYNQLLSRGWRPVPREYIYLDDVTNLNPCKKE